MPSVVISPTRSPASVSRPCAAEPEVAASRRITSRPANPNTSSPATTPADTTAPSVRVASDIVPGQLVGLGRAAMSGTLRHRHAIATAAATPTKPSTDTTRFPTRIVTSSSRSPHLPPWPNRNDSCEQTNDDRPRVTSGHRICRRPNGAPERHRRTRRRSRPIGRSVCGASGSPADCGRLLSQAGGTALIRWPRRPGAACSKTRGFGHRRDRRRAPGPALRGWPQRVVPANYPHASCVSPRCQGPLRAQGSGPQASVKVERPQQSEDE